MIDKPLKKNRNYQRTSLRAPYFESILYTDKNFVFKARALNISEGGLLLDQVPHLPVESDSISMMISLTQYPYFKNFNLERLENFSTDMLRNTIVRVQGEIVRTFEVANKIDEAFVKRIGVKFISIDRDRELLIKDYVNTFSSNLIHLQILIDTLNSKRSNIKKIRILSSILGYQVDLKMSLLYKKVQYDYKSLQWI